MMKAVIFDLDGTLTNTLEDIADAMNRALAGNGLPGWKTEEYRYLVGNGAGMLALRAVRDRTEKAEQVLQDYQKRYERHNMDLTAPYPEIPELLTELNRRGIPLCVLSNKPDADTKHVVGHFFPESRFFQVLGGSGRFPLKPDPAAALWIAEQMKMAPGEFVWLGDSGVDMICARNAGMHPFGALWGFRDREELEESGAEHLLDRPLELLAYFPDKNLSGERKKSQ